MGKHSKPPERSRRPLVVGILIAAAIAAVAALVGVGGMTASAASPQQTSNVTHLNQQPKDAAHNDANQRRYCWRKVIGSHVNVRVRPRLDARVVGKARKGLWIYTPCANEAGDTYFACGKSRWYWGRVYWDSPTRVRYVAATCLRPEA